MSKDKWVVEDKSVTSESAILEAMTIGLYPREYDYTVKDTQSGETKHVTAFNETDLGEKISKGKFSERK